MDRLLLGAGGAAVSFLLVLGGVALLPDALRDSVPNSVIGGVVLVLGVVGALRLGRRAR
ncbi:hypothetical protein [Streptomyces sp. NPDC090022]|uniref:hypothetical protein n=1 Tax=Streptomyces sp. NPDC090022 TaxID=3365920 RepID=UPI00380C6520